MSELDDERARLRAIFRERSQPGQEDLAWEDHQQRVRWASFERAWQTIDARRLVKLEVLEIGCGRGGWLPAFAKHGTRRLAGIDLVPGRIEEAQARLPDADLRVGCASNLPWEAASFDLVVLSTVLSSIECRELRRDLGLEARRVARRDARALVFDLRWPSPWNAAVHRVSVDEVAETLGRRSLRSESLLCLPPLGRRLARRTPSVLDWLERCPLLHTHRLDIVPLNPSAPPTRTA